MNEEAIPTLSPSWKPVDACKRPSVAGSEIVSLPG
ncbi:hypothetical protein ABIA27_001279 [Sinorhizobium fredii]